jgi:hypothetical protein
MKPILVAISILLFVSGYSQSQDSTKAEILVYRFNPKAAFTAYPLGMITSTFRVAADISLPGKKSLKFIPMITTTDYSDVYGADDVFEFGLETHLKFYTASKMKGFYLGPFVSYRSISYSYTDYDYSNRNAPIEIVYNNSATSFRVGYLVGYQLKFSNIATIDASVGGAFNYVTGDYDYIPELGNYVKGVMPHFNLGVGIYLPN